MTDAHEAEATPDPETGPELAPEAAERVSVDIEALQALQAERDDLLDTSRRLQADFENYRKRVLREQTALVDRATEGLIEQLLPVLDSFDLAMANLGESSTGVDKVRKGLELVHTELHAVLERVGLERMDAQGAPFDPNEHDCVMQEDGDGEAVVGDVLRAGWKLNGRVVRPAMVKVTRQ